MSRANLRKFLNFPDSLPFNLLLTSAVTLLVNSAFFVKKCYFDEINCFQIHLSTFLQMKIPENHQQIMPYLMLPDAKGFIQFMEDIFGAKLTYSQNRPDSGIIMHAEVKLGDSTVMLAQANDDWTPATANMFIYVENADATYAKAMENGCESVMELSDKDYGRTCGVKDRFGNVWWVTSV
jgi:uncharacterized glyoxalase superfamily protein PhnB